MSAIATITLPDAQGIPVNHDFNPQKIDGDTATYLESSASSSLGYMPLVVTQRAPLQGQTEKVYRTKISLAMPLVADEVVNGVTRPTLLGTCRFSGDFIFPETATLQNRKDLRKFVLGLLANAQIIANIENQQNTW